MGGFSCALFDVDGTLVDSTRAHGLAWQEAFQQLGLEVTLEDVLADIGMGDREIVRKHLSRKDAERLGERVSELHVRLFESRFLKDIKPFPGATRLLRDLSKRGVNIVLASSAPAELVEKFVELLKIGEVVLGYVSGSDVTEAKPAPDIFEKALTKCGVSKNGTVVIGDSVHDIEAATRAGLPVIAIASGGFTRRELKGAQYIFADLEELAKRVDELFANKENSCEG